MKLTVIFALVLALGSGAPVLVQGSIVTTQAEVTTALVQSALTIEALKNSNDAKCRDLQARIEALTAEVKAGKAKQADLSAAGEALVTRLSEQDRAYKSEIDAFRGAVADIAATPEGATALARYNAGDEAGGLAILDRLQAAQEAADQAATNIAKAEGERRIARLAVNAYYRQFALKQNPPIQPLIARYRAIVALDPGVAQDWVMLARFSSEAKDFAGAADAARGGLKAAANDEDTLDADGALGDALSGIGDLAAAQSAYADEATVGQRIAQRGDPFDAGQWLDALDHLARAEAAAGKSDGATFERATKALGGLRLDSDRQDSEFLLGAISSLGDDATAAGRSDDALQFFREQLVLAQSSSNADVAKIYQLEAAEGIGTVADALADHNNKVDAMRLRAEVIEVESRLIANAPDYLDAVTALGMTESEQAYSLRDGGDAVAARSLYEQALVQLREAVNRRPADALAAEDLSSALEELIDLLDGQNDPETIALSDERLELTRRLASADPADRHAQNEVVDAIFSALLAGSTRVQWKDLVLQLETMAQAAPLDSAQIDLLDEARAEAARAQAR